MPVRAPPPVGEPRAGVVDQHVEGPPHRSASAAANWPAARTRSATSSGQHRDAAAGRLAQPSLGPRGLTAPRIASTDHHSERPAGPTRGRSPCRCRPVAPVTRDLERDGEGHRRPTRVVRAVRPHLHRLRGGGGRGRPAAGARRVAVRGGLRPAARGLLQSLFARSYRLGDFNQVYPLARGTAPMLVALVATAAFGDAMSAARFAPGVAVICGALGVLAFSGIGGCLRPDRRCGPRCSPGSASRRTPLWTVSAFEACKSPATNSGWIFLGMGPLIVGWTAAARGAALLPAVRAQSRVGVVGGVIGVIGYAVVLWAQTHRGAGRGRRAAGDRRGPSARSR